MTEGVNEDESGGRSRESRRVWRATLRLPAFANATALEPRCTRLSDSHERMTTNEYDAVQPQQRTGEYPGAERG